MRKSRYTDEQMVGAVALGREAAARRRGRFFGTCSFALRHRRYARSLLILCPSRPRNTRIRR